MVPLTSGSDAARAPRPDRPGPRVYADLQHVVRLPAMSTLFCDERPRTP